MHIASQETPRLVRTLVGVHFDLNVITLLMGPSWMDPQWLLTQYGGAFFWISMAIVFVECGLLFPILPGDSLLFAIGMFTATGALHLPLWQTLPLLFLAAFAGNVSGYEIGRLAGGPLYERDGRFIKRKYFDQTHTFFDKHGSKALILGRFVPIVRTFITVVAGASKMSRRHFFTWSAVGALLWVGLVTLAGYFLGKVIPGLDKNIDLVILVIVFVSVLPMVWEWWRHRSAVKGVVDETVEEAREG